MYCLRDVEREADMVFLMHIRLRVCFLFAHSNFVGRILPFYAPARVLFVFCEKLSNIHKTEKTSIGKETFFDDRNDNTLEKRKKGCP